MMLAMISVLGPPVARLIAVTQSGQYFVPIQIGVPAAFLAWCLVSDWIKYRIVHPVYAIGGSILLISLPVRFRACADAGVGERRPVDGGDVSGASSPFPGNGAGPQGAMSE